MSSWPFARNFEKEEAIYKLSKRSEWDTLDIIVEGHLSGDINYEKDTISALAEYVNKTPLPIVYKILEKMNN